VRTGGKEKRVEKWSSRVQERTNQGQSTLESTIGRRRKLWKGGGSTFAKVIKVRQTSPEDKGEGRGRRKS